MKQASTPAEPCPALFDLWAGVYDDEQNPLLHLEQRTLTPLLPPLEGAHIFDAGCGTGRWLQHLEHHKPASLTGLDSSPAMLARAASRLASTTTLHLGDCASLPAPNHSCDLVLSSCVLSYLFDLAAFAREAMRILKPGGCLLVTDMHPRTAAERAWTRSFSHGEAIIDIASNPQTLPQIMATFEQAGFTINTLAEPSFADPEQAIFVMANKLAAYADLVDVPAIYILKLHKPVRLQIVCNAWASSSTTWTQTPLVCEDGRIAASPQAHKGTITIDLNGYVVLPGLINAHDHLEFALFPNLGRAAGEPSYNNASEWAAEIHHTHATTIERHLRVPLRTRLWWGAINNLLCGVTSVCHHNPLHPDLLTPYFPIRIVTAFAWGHSLAFEPDLLQRFTQTPAELPFILHAAEGVDLQSLAEFDELKRLQIIDRHTVLVHALALTLREIEIINQHQAAVILCPTSNHFLFNRIMSPTLIETIQRVALASDSPITARGDLLDEVRFLHRRERIAPEDLYAMVTTSPAEILHLANGEGTLRPGANADFIVVRDHQLSPAATLAALALSDVELVVIAGRVQVASQRLYSRLPETLRDGLHPIFVAGHLRWLRAPLTQLLNSAEEHLGSGQVHLGGKVLAHAPTH